MDPAEVLRYVPEVEAAFGLSAGSYESAPMLAQFRARLAKWPRFKNRNVATLLAGRIQELPRLRVLLNAVATDFRVTDGRIASVTARSRAGREIQIAAREVIFAAGAIETTRLLLLMDRQNGFELFSADDQLGRFFSDHLSAAVAEVRPRDRAALNVLAGFRFEPGGAMRNLRFELADASPLRATIPPCFVHIGFTDNKAGGFEALREVLRRLQRRQLPGARLLGRLAAASPWLLHAIWWRFARQRLLYPKSSKIELHIVIEQVPRANSCIRLSRDRVDGFGLPLAEISWDVDSQDVVNLRRASDAFSHAWSESPMARVAGLSHYDLPDLREDLVRGGGVFHPVGSVRMGRSPEQAVVDGELRPFRVRNASIVSTAVLPRGGGANPTMMLLCLGMRCADGIDAKLGPSH
jgi:choline dehydrogenase-like flavoprotein